MSLLTESYLRIKIQFFTTRNWHETFAESFTSSRNINDENKIEENKSLAREMENDA